MISKPGVLEHASLRWHANTTCLIAQTANKATGETRGFDRRILFRKMLSALTREGARPSFASAVNVNQRGTRLARTLSATTQNPRASRCPRGALNLGKRN